MSLEFFLTSLVIILMPGTGVLYTIAIGLGRGTLLNVLNPKLSLFFLAFLPQFVTVSRQGLILTLSYLALMFMAMTFIVFVLYGAFASLARKHIIESPKIMTWLKRGFAGAFGILGMKLALAER